MEGHEVPLEHLREEIHHYATHGNVPWSLIFGLAGAVFLALGSLAH